MEDSHATVVIKQFAKTICFCNVHIRWKSVHGRTKLFVVKWLGHSVTVRVRVGDRE